MKLTWSADPEYQYLYYMRVARQIHLGFYQNIRAVVLPYPHKLAYCFPELELFRDREFISELEQYTSEKDWRDIKRPIVEKVKDRFPAELLVKKQDFELDKLNFEKIAGKFEEYIDFLFTKIDQPEEIIIIPTKFGTNGSFLQSADKKTFFVTYRLDFGWATVIQGILGRYVTSSMVIDQNNAELWGKRQAIIDFLVTNSKISELFEGHEITRTLDFINTYKGGIYEESAEYFKKLGYPIKSCFFYERDTILYANEPVLYLEAKEIEIFKLLIDNRDRIVDFDTIAKKYWGEQEWLDKFSFTSISKVIENIRKKLALNNIPNKFIITVRKKGYMLYD